MNADPKNILLINCDWRDIFRGDSDELYKKLERDRLRPDLNPFFIFSWGTESYQAASRDPRGADFTTVHKKTHLPFFKPWFDFLSYFSVAKALKGADFKPDAIVVYDFGFVPAARRIAEKSGTQKAKVVMCINNMPRLYSATRRFGFFKSFYSRCLEFFFKASVDEYFTINDAMKAYLLDLRIPAEKIHMFAMDTIDRDMSSIQKAKKGLIRARYHIPAQARVLVTVARLEAEKGYPRLLDLFATLDDSHYLLILGQGSLKAQLQAQAKKLGIENRLIFAGWVGRDDIWNHYLDADCFVLLSNVEALGVVVWEAMYMNLPVLGSEAPGIVESTGADGDRGYTLLPGNGEKMFKEKLAKCLVPTADRAAMLDRAKKYVEGKIANNLTLNDIL
jgi:glycosyltransferase involved in cell wall biosynthesis